MKYLCDSGISPQTIAAPGAVAKEQHVSQCRRNIGFRGLRSPDASKRKKPEEDVSRRRRFYCADDELIHAEGRTYAFTNQWGHRTISAINNLIQAFPDHHITCAKSEDEP